MTSYVSLRMRLIAFTYLELDLEHTVLSSFCEFLLFFIHQHAVFLLCQSVEEAKENLQVRN